MDALARLEPIARPLLRQIDEALETLGAPPAHEVWSLLRQVGATPADAVTAFADLIGADLSGADSLGRDSLGSDSLGSDSLGGGLRAAAGTLRELAEQYAAVAIPAGVPWAGGAGEAYSARAAALASYLHGDDDDTMAGRLATTASYVDDVADWQARSRDRIARALADVLSSAQAVTLRMQSASGSGSGAGRVEAAADVGAHVLAAAADALADGHDVHRAWADRLDELPFRGPLDAGPGRFDTAIRLSH